MNLLTKAWQWVARDLGLTDPRLSEAMSHGRQSHSGERVDSNSVLGLATAWACVNLLAGTIGSLPIIIYRGSRSGVDEEEWDHPLYRVLSESPNADQTPLDFMEFTSASIELYGNSYCEVERGAGGRVIGLHVPVSPEGMMVRRRSDGEIEYEWRDGTGRRVESSDRILHIRGFGGGPLGGLSTIAMGRQTFGMAQAIERAAGQAFKMSGRTQGAFVAQKDLNAGQMAEAEQMLLERYQSAMDAGRPLLLNNSVKWETLSINPDDQQMLESRAHSVEEVCRMFATPPHLIGHTAGNTHLGSSIEQQTLSFQVFTLRRRLKRIEQWLEKQLLTPADRARGLKIRFNLQGLLRADSERRARFYQIALQCGWMTINEVRQLEGLPPVDGGDVVRIQMQNQPLTEMIGEGDAPNLDAIEERVRRG